jgi:glyoxylase-like metal-dependent hydrolase (beta-lactamase superfamily II)
MTIKEKIIRPSSKLGSGRVKQYMLPKGRKITQITTFCPDKIGPGPAHVYVIEDEALTLVDTGIPTDLVKKLLYYWRAQPIPPAEDKLPDDYSETELLGGLKAAGYSLKDIELIILTHGHPDHFLMGKTVVEGSKAKVSAHIMDSDTICNPWWLLKRVFDWRPQFAAMGMPAPVLTLYEYYNQVALEALNLSFKVDYPIIMDGPLVLDGYRSDFIHVKHTPGHSPGAICLIIGSEEDADKAMICGDVILYPITPHPDDLVSYLRTLNDIEKLENIAISLPGHGDNIKNLTARARFLKKHHRHRLHLTYKACGTPKSPWDIASMPNYFDTFVDPEKFNPLAGNEAFIHMRLLEMANGLYRKTITGNVHYFQNTGENFDRVYSRVIEIIDDRRSTVL